MSVITTQCPHCFAEKMSLKVSSWYKYDDFKCVIFAYCPKCSMPSSFLLKGQANVGITNLINDQHISSNLEILSYSRLIIIKSYPDVAKHEAPPDCPADVERIYIQAKNAFSRKDLDAAGMLYRKAAELACKAIDPSVKGMFAARVKALADKDIIPKAVSEWANEIRIIGNEAAHDEAPPSEVGIQEAAEFVEAFLEYLFTMPARVNRRKSRHAPPVEES